MGVGVISRPKEWPKVTLVELDASQVRRPAGYLFIGLLGLYVVLRGMMGAAIRPF
jgi:hypothetical protein